MTSAPSVILVRRATEADIAVLAHHRVSMYRDMGDVRESDEARMVEATSAYLRSALACGEYLAWLAYAANAPDDIVAGAGLIVRPMIPRPALAGGIDEREAQIVNVYTELAWRRRGIAALLMQHVLDFAGANGLRRVMLHASAEGRPLYESLGFVPTNEMRLAPPTRG